MQYLVDTNIFLHDIDSNIYGVAVLCKDNGNDMCVTQTIIDELDPGYYRENEDESSKEIYTSVKNFIAGTMGVKVIKLVDLSEVEGATAELKKIRDRYYGWMKDADYLNLLVQRGQLTREDIRKPNFRKRDMGECELVSIAKASAGEYWLITNDQGRVYKHPHINIFDIYENDPDVVILSGRKWLENIGFTNMDVEGDS